MSKEKFNPKRLDPNTRKELAGVIRSTKNKIIQDTLEFVEKIDGPIENWLPDELLRYGYYIVKDAPPGSQAAPAKDK